ncbi:YihY/virulence factor BrkB family protein [Alcanivorax sp. S6407]|uniref:YihY/virulence factor BrkB family protein n=1 Tax=Alcanivorax sp. S6407 TaxID=2926424 RepID=UPI001FF6A54E|nr:YihY/virulence factor BrkB family protein [Alcanivorax sp. S6407]MCK0154177.1 YihY/virulence factor BrkB family protein [Alcanivorax sp. S6407]
MTNHFHQGFNVLKRAVRLWLDSNAGSYAGSLAFFTLFSLAPVIILAVKVISLVMTSDAAMAQVLAQLESTVGPAATEEIRNLISKAQAPTQGLLAGGLSLLAIVIGATTVFAQMQHSMNTIWDVAPRPSRNTILALIKSRLLSLTVVISLGFVLLVSLLLNVIVHSLMNYASHWIPFHGSIAVAMEMLASLLVITLLFATMFRVLPDVILRWKDVLLAALITAILFSIGRALIALYLTYTATASTYGAAGSLVVLLMWVYYSSMILLFGAAMARALCEHRNVDVRPRSTAIRVRRELVH